MLNCLEKYIKLLNNVSNIYVYILKRYLLISKNLFNKIYIHFCMANRHLFDKAALESDEYCKQNQVD